MRRQTKANAGIMARCMARLMALLPPPFRKQAEVTHLGTLLCIPTSDTRTLASLRGISGNTGRQRSNKTEIFSGAARWSQLR